MGLLGALLGAVVELVDHEGRVGKISEEDHDPLVREVDPPDRPGEPAARVAPGQHTGEAFPTL